MAILFGVTLATLIAGAVISAALDVELSDGVVMVLLLAMCAPFLSFHFWIWRAPARALADRTPLGAAIPVDQARREALARVTWGRLAAAAAGTVAWAWFAQEKFSLATWGGRFYLAAAVGMLTLCVVQALRKAAAARVN